MIERLAESNNVAYGFKVVGQLTAEDVVALGEEIDKAIAARGMPIGLLADLSAMQGATWAARWEEMRFLRRHTDFIARMAVVSDDQWEELREQAMVATAVLQAQTQYFTSSERAHAWHWAKMGDTDNAIPVRVMYEGKGLFSDYTPEYVGI